MVTFKVTAEMATSTLMTFWIIGGATGRVLTYILCIRVEPYVLAVELESFQEEFSLSVKLSSCIIPSCTQRPWAASQD